MTTRTLKITLDVNESVTDEEVAQYVADAVGSWGGQFRLEDPLFPANWPSDDLEVLILEESKTMNNQPKPTPGTTVAELCELVAVIQKRAALLESNTLELCSVLDECHTAMLMANCGPPNLWDRTSKVLEKAQLPKAEPLTTTDANGETPQDTDQKPPALTPWTSTRKGPKT